MRFPEPRRGGNHNPTRVRDRPRPAWRHPRARSRPKPAAAAERRLRTRGSRCRSGPRALPGRCAPTGPEAPAEPGPGASLRSLLPQELDVPVKAEEAVAGIDNEGLAGDAARIDKIADRSDHVARVHAAAERIVCVHGGE